MTGSTEVLAPRNVLVTGASGLLGGAVADLLAVKGHKVRTLQRRPGRPGTDSVAGSVADPSAAARAVEGMDAVIHLAAKVSFTGEWEEFEETNILGTQVLLKAARAAGVRDVVFVSSPSVAHFGEPIAGAAAGTADPAGGLATGRINITLRMTGLSG